VNPSELAFGAVVVAVLVLLACFFAWRQVRVLRGLPAQAELSSEDRKYLRGQAWRRLFSSLLMLILAGLLAGSVLFEGPREQIHQERVAQGPSEAVRAEHQEFARWFTTYWIVILLVLMALLLVVAVDIWAIARFGARQHRQLRAELQATLASEVQRLRRGSNGQQR
jgi:hypothetical protein